MKYTNTVAKAATIFIALLIATLAEAKLAKLLVTDTSTHKPIGLEAAEVEVQVDGTSARVSYDLVFQSRLGGALEGTFYFALPRNSYVHDFGMWINGVYQGSAIVEAKAGRVAYETIVSRGIDPALLEWTAGNNSRCAYSQLSAVSRHEFA